MAEAVICCSSAHHPFVQMQNVTIGRVGVDHGKDNAEDATRDCHF